MQWKSFEIAFMVAGI